MEYIINIIYKFIKNYENVKILNNKDTNISYYFYFINYKYNDETVYCYLDLYKFFSVIISLIIFFIFWNFNICIIPLYIINYIIIFLSISFILNMIILILNFILGLWRKLYKYDEDLFNECLERIFQYINFLINISLVYYILNLDINLLLQYNIIFVIDYIGKQILWFYSYFYKIEIDSELIPNFISYPIISLIILRLSLYSKSGFKYWWCLCFHKYGYVFNFKLIHFDKK